MNWEQRIERAEKRGRFTVADLKLARKWTTCAVGENRGHYAERRGDHGYPIDRPLIRLGAHFVGAVASDKVAEAKRTLTKIGRRITTLPAKSRPA